MSLKPFIARHVNPGEPLTAQAWNEVVDGVSDVNEYLRATLHTVHVNITPTGIDLSKVRVVAVREGAPPVESVRPVPPDTHHILSGLTPGSYTLYAEAPGFNSATAPLTVDSDSDEVVTIPLTAVMIPMPNLFGMPLIQARAMLTELAITVSNLFDFAGKALAPLNPGAEYDLAPVLVQMPPPGTLIGAAGASVQLAVATAQKLDTSVAVPSLAGLTLVEAKKALEGLGLVLGNVRSVSRADQVLRNVDK